MDITLERILSLIPKRPDGEYLHGAKKEFAQSIGYSGGEIINMWESGDSKSYLKKIHEISSKYDVSLDWLMGKTDERKPTSVSEDGLSSEAKEIIRLYDLASPELRSAALAVLKSAEAVDRVPGDSAKEK